MNKKILLAGGSGLVGSNILTLLNNSNVELTLLSRRALEHKIGLKQIVSDFDNLHKLNGEFHFDEVYIAIGKKVMATEKKDKDKFNRLQQEQRDLDASYQQSKLNKKERDDKEE